MRGRRLPDEPRVRLARAMAVASRYDITSEMNTPRAGVRTGPVGSAMPVIRVSPALGGLRRRAALGAGRVRDAAASRSRERSVRRRRSASSPWLSARSRGRIRSGARSRACGRGGESGSAVPGLPRVLSLGPRVAGARRPGGGRGPWTRARWRRGPDSSRPRSASRRFDFCDGDSDPAYDLVEHLAPSGRRRRPVADVSLRRFTRLPALQAARCAAKGRSMSRRALLSARVAPGVVLAGTAVTYRSQNTRQKCIARRPCRCPLNAVCQERQQRRRESDRRPISG